MIDLKIAVSNFNGFVFDVYWGIYIFTFCKPKYVGRSSEVNLWKNVVGCFSNEFRIYSKNDKNVFLLGLKVTITTHNWCFVNIPTYETNKSNLITRYSSANMVLHSQSLVEFIQMKVKKIIMKSFIHSRYLFNSMNSRRGTEINVGSGSKFLRWCGIFKLCLCLRKVRWLAKSIWQISMVIWSLPFRSLRKAFW